MYAPSLTDRVSGSATLARRRTVGRGLGRVLGRLDVIGLDNAPQRGPLVVAGNLLIARGRVDRACHGTDATERRVVSKTTEEIRAALAALVSATAPSTPQREAA